MSASTDDAAGRILVVCTGNVCRSPYIERLLDAQLSGTGISIASAGTGALVGSAMDPQAEQRLIRAGGDPAGFVARQLTSALIRQADLVLCATRQHRSMVVRAEPKGLRYTHALADFSDLARAMGQAPQLTEGKPNVVGGIATAATLHRHLINPRTADQADIVDPYRRPAAVFDQMVEQVQTLLPPIVAVLSQAAPTAPNPDGQG
jgi:protein-tyrosine phosphatase